MKIPQFKINWSPADIAATAKVIKSGSYWTVGPNIKELEKRIANYTKRKYCLVFNSGTSALHSILLAYGIGHDDEVIVPSFTFIATANAVIACGAKVRFVDIEAKTLGLDPEQIEKNITKKTKAVIAVHFGGQPCQIEAIKRIADRFGILLIEDAAEAFGAKCKNKMAGSFADSAIFSFCQNKIITCGEGGAIVTDNRNLFDKLFLIRSHGRNEPDNHSPDLPIDYVMLGYNFRLSSLAAALLLSQFQRVEKIISQRIRKAGYYLKKLKNISQIKTIAAGKNSENVFQLFPILASNRNELKDYLLSKGISSKIYFEPVHQSHFYRKILGYKIHLPTTEVISKQIICLPIYPDIKHKEIDYIIKTIKDFYRYGKRKT